MTAQNRNRWILVGALVVAGGGLAYISLGKMSENLVYYWSPGEMIAQGEKAYHATIRLGGVVQKGSLDWDVAHTKLSFKVADGPDSAAPVVTVVSDQVPPQMLREGIGCVVEGTYDASHVFSAQRIMVKHSNEYKPPKGGEKHDWKDTLADTSQGSK